MTPDYILLSRAARQRDLDSRTLAAIAIKHNIDIIRLSPRRRYISARAIDALFHQASDGTPAASQRSA